MMPIEMFYSSIILIMALIWYELNNIAEVLERN